MEAMNPLPAPKVPGDTEAERFDNAVRKMFVVSKEELQKRDAKWSRDRAKKKAKKSSATALDASREKLSSHAD